jgi:hypothetical protein
LRDYFNIPYFRFKTDPLYLFAQLAAIDLACMGVLVASSGGMFLGAAR